MYTTGSVTVNGTTSSNIFVNTTTTVGSSSQLGSIGGYNPISPISPITHRYTILGETVDHSGYCDMNMSIIIAMINTVGIKYYDEMKKQGATLHGDIGKFLEAKLKSYYRDNKIDEVIK